MTEKRDPGVDAANAARAELYDTLSQLRDRLDFAQRIDDRVQETSRQLSDLRRRRPLEFAAGAVAVAGVAGLIVWGIARRVARRIQG